MLDHQTSQDEFISVFISGLAPAGSSRISGYNSNDEALEELEDEVEDTDGYDGVDHRSGEDDGMVRTMEMVKTMGWRRRWG
jgi:hypothetical protein